MNSLLGVNNAYFKLKEYTELDINRIEICLGRDGTYKSLLKNALKTINYCEINKLNYSIHLPIFLYDWYPYDYLSAFFLNENPILRKKSFLLLEKNLEELKNFSMEYCVLHFPGINHSIRDFKKFNKILNTSLSKVDELAKKYDIKILLEYFGSNILFKDYNIWIEKIDKYENIGLLLDTGHLYFSSQMHNFDFKKAFIKMKEEVEAFHFWTVKGKGFYGNNEYYKKYHHIVPNLNQNSTKGWAFNTKEIFSLMIETSKPIIIEASNEYRGDNFFYESIDELYRFKSLFKNNY